MLSFSRIRQLLVGAPRNPLEPGTRRHILLVAFLAWVGLGADGLSSSAYGPELGFLALGEHTHLGLYLAVVTALTVFIISLAYNQVIELFPSGGGGYKVATQLISPHTGLVSGAALIVDYVLTIAISIASGVDALFSLLPLSAQAWKLETAIALTLLLIVLNLRGMKESIKVLMPIFLGFVLTHAALIVYGILAHAERLPSLIPDTIQETMNLNQQAGWMFVVALFLRAYSLGGGTYTGLEAVSNNVNTLAEPRVRTGRWTMFYLATSLAFTAGGIILLYLLWDAKPVAGQTLNAVTFGSILSGLQWQGWDVSHALLLIVMALEAGLLFVAANTGFLGGPAVLANMAADSWVPRQFLHLSGRLVTQNGVLLMGLTALAVLIWSGGSVGTLVVLYSINVFLTFSLSLLGLSVYWWQHRFDERKWRWRLPLSLLGLTVTGGMLLVMVVEKFTEGGWATVLITSMVIGICLVIKRHYEETRTQLRAIDKLFATAPIEPVEKPPPLDPQQPTAVFLSGHSRGTAMHTLLWVQRLFPGHFKNFIFLGAGEVDSQSYRGQNTLETLQYVVRAALNHHVNYCHSRGWAAVSYESYGTDPVEQLTQLAEQVGKEFPNSMFFASKLVFVHDNWLTRLLHNQTALALQRRLHLRGMQMFIIPMKLE
ncbi:MAG TPA: APC family permease [Gammaproteobacteria bacterium]|nr:APC family permease [Gammaproteobacteria bacterium]